MIVAITILAILAVYVIETNKQKTAYENAITFLQSENDGLQEIVASNVSRNDYQLLLNELRNDGLSSLYSVPSTTTPNSHFLGDLIVLYGEIDNHIFALELDFNRLEKTPGLFNHYTLLS